MSFVRIRDAEELMAQALDMSELERDCFFEMGEGEHTVKDLVERTGRSRSMVQRALKDLHDKGVVVREGKVDRTIYYVYRRVPMEQVQEQVERVLDRWHSDMKDLVNN